MDSSFKNHNFAFFCVVCIDLEKVNVSKKNLQAADLFDIEQKGSIKYGQTVGTSYKVEQIRTQIRSTCK